MTKLKSIGIAFGGLLTLFLILAGIKGGQIFAMIQNGKSFVPPPESVSTFTTVRQSWPNTFRAVGTIEADEGIVIAAEVAGKVQRIAFKSGQPVKAGTVLVEQESSNEKAQLDAFTARLHLATSNYQRLQQLRKSNLISQSDLDTGLQQLQSAQGDVDNIKATLQKKVIRAPFDGRLGIRQIDLGKDLLVGSPIVSLQATNRVRVNFPVPQDWLMAMRKGQAVEVHMGDSAGTIIKGEVTAIGADINIKTRSATVQSSLANADNRLIPGMAVATEVTLSEPQDILVVPSAAVIYASFGDTLFVVDAGDKPGSLKARQQFVRLGKARGDFVEVLQGIKEGEKVVSAGAFKLFNGQAVVISESKTPEFKVAPVPTDT